TDHDRAVGFDRSLDDAVDAEGPRPAEIAVHRGAGGDDVVDVESRNVVLRVASEGPHVWMRIPGRARRARDLERAPCTFRRGCAAGGADVGSRTTAVGDRLRLPVTPLATPATPRAPRLHLRGDLRDRLVVQRASRGWKKV